MKAAKWILVLSAMMILVFLQTQPLSAANYYYSGNHLVELILED